MAFIGQISMFAGNFAPLGWAFCDGQLLPISQYNALFSLLGTTYGGDGVNDFGLPDLRGRVPMHEGQGPGLNQRRLGEKRGKEDVILNTHQMPSHSHGVSIKTGDPNDSKQPPETGGLNLKSAAATNNKVVDAVEIGATGGGQPHDNMQPYLCVNFIIALEGEYPSRN